MMRFEPGFLQNKMFEEQPLVFDPYLGEVIDGMLIKTGIFYQEDGGVQLRLYAPSVQRISALIVKKEYPFERKETGWHELLVPFDNYRNGPLTVDLSFDGVWLLYPGMPIYWSANAAHNYVEFPHPDQAFAQLRDVPHGAVTRQIYYSAVLGQYERCLVYTPPGYMNGQDAYPVLYLQHGSGENETVWESTGRIHCILDNLIADGKCVPMIVVMNNDMLRFPGNEGKDPDHAFENMLIRDCIPFIEAHYRTRNDKWSRAICGLSMGAYLTNDIAFFHPECFGYVGSLTGCMHHHSPMAQYERPWKEAMKTDKVVRENFRVFYQSATPMEDHFDYCLIDRQICEENGVADLLGYRFIAHPPYTCKWASWRIGLRDFAKLLFRDADVYQDKEKLKRYD